MRQYLQSVEKIACGDSGAGPLGKQDCGRKCNASKFFGEGALGHGVKDNVSSAGRTEHFGKW